MLKTYLGSLTPILTLIFLSLALASSTPDAIPGASKLKTSSLQVRHADLIDHMRHDDPPSIAIERATMRYVSAYLKKRDSSQAAALVPRDASDDPGETKQRIIAYYVPDYDDICFRAGFPGGATAQPRFCLDQVRFLVSCSATGSRRGHSNRARDGSCVQNFFCATVIRGTLTVSDPDNTPASAFTDAVCVKIIEIYIENLMTTVAELMTAWTEVPTELRIAFTRIELTGATNGVPITMQFFSRPKGKTWIRNNLGTKNILSESKGNEHEYELSYNYNGADVEMAGAISLGPHPKVGYRFQYFLGFAK